ncbi:MAG: RNA polymerase sigma factor [Anaerostipes hadrus]
MLVKKNPLLFSEMAVDQEGEEYVYDVEDEDPENQPELAYTREETKELVHVLLDGLSEEQRMAILMFHLENASISEITGNGVFRKYSKIKIKLWTKESKDSGGTITEERIQTLRCGSSFTSCILAA